MSLKKLLPGQPVTSDGRPGSSVIIEIIQRLVGRVNEIAAASGALWGSISGNIADQADLQAALGGKANTSHTHTASQISDGTTAGRSMLTAANAAAQTALLDTFTSGAKGLAPASGGGTTNFLRADGTWAVAGGSASVETVEVDFTTASRGRFFDIALAGASVGQQVVAAPSLDMPAGIGEDELEMEPILAHGRVLSSGNIRLFVGSVLGGPVHGKRNINVTLG